MDFGTNTEFKAKLKPEEDKDVCSRNVTIPIYLKEHLIVKIALMHNFWIITVLPFSKYASPIFEQRKPKGKLRLVDLRKINILIEDDYTNNNHPVSTSSGAAQHLAARNSLFCKLDCSQAYHCLHMTNERSVEILAFNFAGRTFAYKRPAHSLSRSLSVFLRFMREYLDPLVKADQYAQYEDYIRIAASNATDLTRNIRAVFHCIRRARLKPTKERATLESDRLNSLAEQFHQKEFHRQLGRFTTFLTKSDYPNRKRPYSGTWASYITTKTISPGGPRNLVRFTNCSKQKCQSTSRQNWETPLNQYIKRAVMLVN